MYEVKDLLRTTKSPETATYSVVLNADGVRGKGHTGQVKV